MKKGYILKLPTSVGPFTINPRHALPTVEKFLQGMDLPQEKFWPYEPKGFLSSRKRKIKSTADTHETRPFIEWRANLDTWPLYAKMEAESSAAEGKGDNVSIGTEEQAQAGTSGSHEGMDTDEGAHPHKNRELKGQMI